MTLPLFLYLLNGQSHISQSKECGTGRIKGSDMRQSQYVSVKAGRPREIGGCYRNLMKTLYF